MITIDNLCFVLETKQTAYAFDVSGGVLRHLYYGAKLRRLEDYVLAAPRPLFAPGNAAVLGGGVSLEDMAQECSSVRCPTEGALPPSALPTMSGA